MFELGNNLREARQRRQIDLVAAEQDTKIRSKYLAALETEDFDILPGPVFVRGFLRTYARYLGLDAQLFVDEYNARFGRFEDVDDHSIPVLGRPGLAQQRVNRGRRTMRFVVITSLVVLGLLVWLGLRTDADTTAADAPTPRSQPVEPAPSEATPPGSLDSAARAANATPPAASTAAATPASETASTPAPAPAER